MGWPDSRWHDCCARNFLALAFPHARLGCVPPRESDPAAPAGKPARPARQVEAQAFPNDEPTHEVGFCISEAGMSHCANHPLPSPDQAAMWIVVGWQREWRMTQVLDALGVQDIDFAELHAAAPCLPDHGRYYKHPVRAMVAREWPRLSAWLWKNAKDAGRLQAVIPKVASMTAHGRGADAAIHQDIVELNSSSKANLAQTMGYWRSRESFKSHQRSAWNVCKG